MKKIAIFSVTVVLFLICFFCNQLSVAQSYFPQAIKTCEKYSQDGSASYNNETFGILITLQKSKNDMCTYKEKIYQGNEYQMLTCNFHSSQLADISDSMTRYNDTFRTTSTLRQLSANLYLESGLKKWQDTYDIVLGGGYTSCRAGGLEIGEVTYADIQTRFPFDNDIYLCSIPGSTLKSRFINTTNSDYYIALSSYGESIKDKISSSKTYYIISDTYNIDYAANKLTKIERLSLFYLNLY
jgi:2',3'-cyclic-nucleotide 2'-phosphodiesterase (5'-nucleotidase family)